MPQLHDRRHEAFAIALMRGLPKYQAYQHAGFTPGTTQSASTGAAKLYRSPKVRARVKELQQEAAQTAVIDSGMVLRRMWRNVQIAMGDLPVSQTRMDRKTGQPMAVETYTYDGTAANRGLELIGRELGMFTERREIGGPGDFGKMDDAALVAYVAGKLAARGVTTIEGSAVETGGDSGGDAARDPGAQPATTALPAPSMADTASAADTAG